VIDSDGIGDSGVMVSSSLAATLSLWATVNSGS